MAKARLDGERTLLSVDPDELFGLDFVEAEDQRYFMFERDRGKQMNEISFINADFMLPQNEAVARVSVLRVLHHAAHGRSKLA